METSTKIDFFVKSRWFYTAFALLEIFEAYQDYRHSHLYWWRPLLVIGFSGVCGYGWLHFFRNRQQGPKQ
jgi:hypothetical protein